MAKILIGIMLVFQQETQNVCSPLLNAVAIPGSIHRTKTMVSLKKILKIKYKIFQKNEIKIWLFQKILLYLYCKSSLKNRVSCYEIDLKYNVILLLTLWF